MDDVARCGPFQRDGQIEPLVGVGRLDDAEGLRPTGAEAAVTERPVAAGQHPGPAGAMGGQVDARTGEPGDGDRHARRRCRRQLAWACRTTHATWDLPRAPVTDQGAVAFGPTPGRLTSTELSTVEPGSVTKSTTI